MTTPEGAKGWVDQAGSAQVLAGGHGLNVTPDASPEGVRAKARREDDGTGGEPSNAPVAAAFVIVQRDVAMSLDAGRSTCPICEREWLVTPFDDCMVPACGCYGNDTSAANPARPCDTCGTRHAWSCSKIEGHERRAEHPHPRHIEIIPGVGTIEKKRL